MALQIVWFVLWGILWAAYFMLDGFVLGTGLLNYTLARTDTQRRVLINSVGPVWDGNEVWLITAGGATFAAFPAAYAMLFSAFYLPLVLLLLALIVRGVALEFRAKVDDPTWRSWCDRGMFLGSLAPAFLFGVAFGNLFRGIPIDASGYAGTLSGLLNPYALLTGAFAVLLFAFHGSLWAAMKTEGELSARSAAVAGTLWPYVLGGAAVLILWTPVTTALGGNYRAVPALLLLPLAATAALVAARLLLSRGRQGGAFLASCAAVVGMVAAPLAGMFPRIIPSSIDPALSLTAFNASSSRYTLGIMTAVALVFVPLVVGYKIWVYRVFRGRVGEASLRGNPQAY